MCEAEGEEVRTVDEPTHGEGVWSGPTMLAPALLGCVCCLRVALARGESPVRHPAMGRQVCKSLSRLLLVGRGDGRLTVRILDDAKFHDVFCMCVGGPCLTVEISSR